MTFDELLERIAAEPATTTERDVRLANPDLVAELHRAGGMRLNEYIADPRHTLQRRVFREGHLLGSGASPAALAEWQTQWPRHPLPRDLADLLLRVNGIHLWADLETGRSYEGLAPLEEWDLARVKMWGPGVSEASLADRYLRSRIIRTTPRSSY